jgi:hypothetical protein
MRLSSIAGPLPTGAIGPRFPLTAGSARCIQEADFNQILVADPAILGCVNRVFRCRQRNCGGALRLSDSDRQILEWREILEWRDWQKAVGHGWNRDAILMAPPSGAFLALRCVATWTSVALAQKMLAKYDTPISAG